MKTSLSASTKGCAARQILRRAATLPALHPELSRRRGAACAAWARPLLRERPLLGIEIRTHDVATPSPASSSAERSLAPRRDGRPDRWQADVSLARGRPRRRDPRRAAAAPARPPRGRQADAQAAAKTRLRAKDGD